MKPFFVFLLLLALIGSSDLGLVHARGATAGRAGASGRTFFNGSHVVIPPARFSGHGAVVVSPFVGWHRGHSPVFPRYPIYRRWFYPTYPGVVVVSPPYYYESQYSQYYGPQAYVPPVPGYQNNAGTSAATAGEAATRSGGQWAPFDPTPGDVVERMLLLAQVKKGDVVYDLGAGDGRIVIAAAKKYGVKAVGFEIDPGLVKLARENVRNQRLEKLVEIRQQDFMGVDLSPATVVTLYLSYDGNQALRSNIETQLKPGARVVSYTFDMGDWQPKIAESYRDQAGNVHMLYLWQIGERPTN
jgi:SAM-dependent methyltransferase